MDNDFLNPVRNTISNGVKLTNTVYKVLEFFPESDPLKHRAKDRALSIMENLILVNETKRLPAGRQGWATVADVFSETKIKTHISEDIDVLLGYLWIGKSQGWLNSVNCLIVANEYEKIKKWMGPAIEFEVEPTLKLPGMDEQQESEVVVSDRQGKILEFLKNPPAGGEKVQVSDLQTIFPDITKRTIRRDLDELLESGKIVRMGDFNEVFYKIK
jgi:Fe2+ or Zn2+ uptake regulation protein